MILSNVCRLEIVVAFPLVALKLAVGGYTVGSIKPAMVQEATPNARVATTITFYLTG